MFILKNFCQKLSTNLDSKVHTYKLNWHISLFLKHHNIGLRTIKPSLKAVFQLHVFYTYVHARESLNHFNITFEVNKCFDGENSAFPTIQHALVILFVKYKLLTRVKTFTCVHVRVKNG